MEILSCKKYNEKQTLKWHKDYDICMKKIHAGERHITELPQLVMYVFLKKYGYVAFDGNRALWDKSKAGVIAWWNDEERKRKIRGW